MQLSVLSPIDAAFRRTKQVLFAPFSLEKWLKLGFCAFLVQLGDCSGGSGNANANVDGGGGGGFGRHVEDFTEWFEEYQALILAIGIPVAVVLLAIMLALVWLQSRGRFMFLDGVVHDRGAVVAPWKGFRREGNNLFLFAAALNLLTAALSIGGLVVGVMLAWPDMADGRFGDEALAGMLVGGCVFLFAVLGYSLVNLFLNDFVVPAMYARRVPVLEAWRDVYREILGPRLGVALLYVLVKIAIAVVSAMLVFGLICGTLCIAACFLAIPYVGTVVLLPLIVFDRSYSLAFLAQLGGDWDLTPAASEPETVLE
jgi:hypothetical protein